jgi:hypothetical protein
MIAPHIKVDTRSLNAAILELQKNSNKSLSKIVNKKIGFIVGNAIKLTIKASASKIVRQMNAIVKGRNATLASIIVNMNQTKQGKPGFKGRKMREAISKFKQRRKAAINYARASWIWALRTILQSTGGSMTDIKATGKYRSKAKVAPKEGGLNIVASAWSTITKDNPRITRVLSRGIQDAIDKEADSTWQHIADKQLQEEACNKFNGR